MLNRIHHIAVICSDYEASKQFYIGILGLTPIHEVYRAERQSHKLDLALHGQYVLELFSFPNPPQRVSQPEATGLRHLAFEVDNVAAVIEHLSRFKVTTEPIRFDDITGKHFTFCFDPDGLPVEFYER